MLNNPANTNWNDVLGVLFGLATTKILLNTVLLASEALYMPNKKKRKENSNKMAIAHIAHPGIAHTKSLTTSNWDHLQSKLFLIPFTTDVSCVKRP
jgi:uncharacterized membrane protein required for colicin V production